jgi:protein associated with RNAse G/E
MLKKHYKDHQRTMAYWSHLRRKLARTQETIESWCEERAAGLVTFIISFHILHYS